MLSRFINKMGTDKKKGEGTIKKTAIRILVACLGIIGCAPIILSSVPLEAHDLAPIFSKEPITLVNAQEVSGNTT